MSTPLEEFGEKFRTAELAILRLTHWTWSVRPVHCTVGAGILSLNRECLNLGSITTEEGAELAQMANEIETRLRRSFSPAKFNYVMLMMVDRQLHFHVISRYDHTVEFGGREWVDKGWPALPELGDGADLQADAVLIEIRDELSRD